MVARQISSRVRCSALRPIFIAVFATFRLFTARKPSKRTMLPDRE